MVDNQALFVLLPNKLAPSARQKRLTTQKHSHVARPTPVEYSRLIGFHHTTQKKSHWQLFQLAVTDGGASGRGFYSD